MISGWLDAVEDDVVACLCRTESLTPRELATRLGVSEGTAVSYVVLLASSGRLEIERSPYRRRRGSGEGAMEYLLEIKWSDPVADTLADIFSALPTDVEQRTASVPPRTNRGFVVLSARDRAALESVADAVAAAGAAVRVTAGREA